jgi:hypothetical protein
MCGQERGDSNVKPMVHKINTKFLKINKRVANSYVLYINATQTYCVSGASSKLTAFLTSVLKEMKWSVARPGHLINGEAASDTS